MASIKKVRHEKEMGRSFFVSVVAVVIAGLSLAWQVYHSTAQKRSYDKQFGNIETSLRLLTATVAPQLQKAIDDSLVSALNDSPPQAASALAKVENDTASLRKLQAKLPAQEIAQSAELLHKAVNQNPDAVSGWGAVAQMVSYRSELQTEPKQLADCFATQGRGGFQASNQVMHYRNCVLNLDNSADFNAIAPHLHQGTMNGTLVPTIVLEDGVVKYSGGQMITFERLICRNCAFNLDSPKNVPPPSGRALSQQLLLANLSDISFSQPSA